MIVMVINAGSSSVKFTCFELSEEGREGSKVLAKGLIERIGTHGTCHSYSNHKGLRLEDERLACANASEAARIITNLLTSPNYGVLSSLDEIKALGHRCGHGGDVVTGPMLVDDKVRGILKEFAVLAPLHNPVHLASLETWRNFFPKLPHVAVFDSAFHHSIPPRAFLYALPLNYWRENKIRRYGFHGTSVSYVMSKAVSLMNLDPQKSRIVVCHIGSGASVTAVKDGKSIDNSMGLTPLEGVIMGTRPGDVDAGAILQVMRIGDKSVDQMDRLLNKECGLHALGGLNSPDLRDVEKGCAEGNQDCCRALDAYCYRVKKYIGAYMAALGGLDGIVFTAGAGENSPTLRNGACSDMADLGIVIDQEANKVRGKEPRLISTRQSRVKVAVIPTDEELEIAIQTMLTVKSL